ncbi:hypothetical protein Tco_0394183 [Tanacetum coccineum]
MTVTIRDDGYWHTMPGDYFFDVQPGKGFHTICLSDRVMINDLIRSGSFRLKASATTFAFQVLADISHRNCKAILTNSIASCLILSDEEYVEGFCDQ